MEAFYKLAYDISCYYAFAAFFLSYVAGYRVNPLSFLVFFAACLAAVNAEKIKRGSQAMQMSAFVLPIIPFLLENNLWGKLIIILPWVYMVVTVLRQGYYVSYRRFRKTYLCFFWFFAALFGFFIAEDFAKGEVAILVAGPFLLLLLGAGIFLLQMLRFQAGSCEQKILEKYQRRQLVFFLIAATLLTVGNVVELLYVYVFYPLTKLVLGAGLALIVFIIGKLDRPLKPPKEMGDMGGDVKEFTEQLEEAYANVETIWGKIPEKVRQLPTKEMDYTPLIIILAVLTAIIILVVLIGGRRIKRKQAVIEEEREECYDEIKVGEVIKKRSARPEIVIRYYYREFMKKSEAKKHKLEVSDTTNEILTKYRAWNDATPEQTAEAEEATALYQKTRYSKAKVTRADAGRMKALVKGL